MWALILSLFISLAGLFTGGLLAFPAEKDKTEMEMKKLLPLEIEGYRSDGKDQVYDRVTTFRYMDGAAELYLSYGFKQLVVRRYVKENQTPILVELFDMGSPEDAFGVFSFEAEGEETGIGHGSDIGGGLLRFWKGKFFTHVYAEQETPSVMEVILKLGKAIARSIQQEGQKPMLLTLLPREGLIERSIRYFHHPHHLNHHYFISHENILNLGPKTKAVLATYPSSSARDKIFLLLIQYGTPAQSKKAYQSFAKTYLPESPSSGIAQTENRKWTAARSHQRYVIIVFDTPSREKAEEMIQATQKVIKEKKP
jgi:hypothetical protein